MKKLRAVLVGCGSISNAWLGAESLQRNVALCGLVDVRLEAARNQQKAYGLTKSMIGTDLHDVLRQTQPDIVFDCTLPSAHHDVTLTALKHGCHVFGEKPMSDTLACAQKMVRAAKRHQRTFAVMQNRRYMTGIRSVQRFLKSGGLGRLVAIHSDFFIGAHFGGFRDEMEHVLLLDMAIHTFDQARFLSGKEPLDVVCQEWTPRHSWYRNGPSAMAMFTMSDEVKYTYRGSWCAEGCPTSWEACWRIIGEKGTLLWDGNEGFHCEVTSGKKGFVRPVKSRKINTCGVSRFANGHNSAIGAFIRDLRMKQRPETDGSDNLKSLKMVHGAVESSISGKRVSLV